MRLLLVTWNGGGNVNPSLALTDQASAAGWDVTALVPESLEGRFAGAGAEVIVRTAAREWDAAAVAEDVQLACEAEQPEAVLVDYMLPAAICGAEQAGVAVLVY